MLLFSHTRWYLVLGVGPGTTSALVSCFTRNVISEKTVQSVMKIYFAGNSADVLQGTIGYYTAQRYLDMVFFIHVSRLLPLDQ